MKYKNGKAVLPEKLLKELQKYVQGEMIYVPCSDPNRAGWGEANGARERYIKRNNEIAMLYRNGATIEQIADRFHLSDHSIRKIIYKNKYKVCIHKKEGVSY